MLSVPDAKWLDFLKAGLPSFVGLSAFAGATLYLNKLGHLPMALPAAAALVVAVIGLLSGCLAVSLLLATAYRAAVWFIKPRYEGHLHRKLAQKRKREFVNYIPYLNDRERLIFAHLLFHNQRTFENTPDCGYASVLFSLGFVQMLGAKGGSREVDYFAVPFGVPDPVWDALVERRDEFPLSRPDGSRSRSLNFSPWRKPVI